jgi:ubiquinone/menaquinone biosynthesis C-methylase UbiE
MSTDELTHDEKMSDASFRLMALLFGILDFFYPYIDTRIQRFGRREGMTVVDYGCGPGRYTTRFSKMVGKTGKVFAVDIHELAIDSVKKKIARRGFTNIVPVLASEYDSTLPDGVADMVCALDMFFSIRIPTNFLAELKRITKSSGILVIDDGHQRRSTTKRKIADSGAWLIVEETKDHLKCKPL